MRARSGQRETRSVSATRYEQSRIQKKSLTVTASVLRLAAAEMQQMFHTAALRPFGDADLATCCTESKGDSSMVGESICRIVFWKLTICRMACRVLLLTAAASALLLSSSNAQTTSTIQGTVTDKQGLAVSGAQLQLSGDTLGTSRTTASPQMRLGIWMSPSIAPLR